MGCFLDRQLQVIAQVVSAEVVWRPRCAHHLVSRRVDDLVAADVYRILPWTELQPRERGFSWDVPANSRMHRWIPICRRSVTMTLMQRFQWRADLLLNNHIHLVRLWILSLFLLLTWAMDILKWRKFGRSLLHIRQYNLGFVDVDRSVQSVFWDSVAHCYLPMISPQ